MKISCLFLVLLDPSEESSSNDNKLKNLILSDEKYKNSLYVCVVIIL